MKPFIKPRPAAPAPAPAGPAPAPTISPNELTIFSVASSLAEVRERAAYLDRACGSDAALRARIEERLQTRASSQAPAATAGPAAAAAPETPAASAPTANAGASELLRVQSSALSAHDRPDALALVPMSAMQFAAAQQPPRHSPVPWTAATILAIAVGALAVFFTTEKKTREQAEQNSVAALKTKEEAERARDGATASALEAKTVAQRAEEARKAAEQEANALKTLAEQQRLEREQALAREKAANEKAQAAQAEVTKLRTETVAGQRANALALADSLGRLGALQIDARAYGEAEASLRQALEIRAQQKADAWSIVENRALLGAVLLQKNQDAAALEEIQAAATSIEQLGPPANDTDRARATAASKRIVQFFNVTGRRKEASDWRRRLDAVLATH